MSSNAPPGAQSARVVLVGLYAERDHSAGSSSVRFRRTAYVFVDTYLRTTLSDNSEIRGDIVFRFLRFGPWCVSPRSFASRGCNAKIAAMGYHAESPKRAST